jgi:aminoglycoside 6-adenylyltransferase
VDKTTQAYEALTERFTARARTEEDIRAAFVIGSPARENHPADEWADSDVGVIVREAATYIAEEEWVRSIGTPWITFVETTLNGQSKERRVLYARALTILVEM